MPKENAQRRDYADEAVTILREAIAAGFKDLVRMQNEPDLNAIRNHEGYKELVGTLKAGQTGNANRDAPDDNGE